jgi:hypothetical protein
VGADMIREVVIPLCFATHLECRHLYSKCGRTVCCLWCPDFINNFGQKTCKMSCFSDWSSVKWLLLISGRITVKTTNGKIIKAAGEWVR